LAGVPFRVTAAGASAVRELVVQTAAVARHLSPSIYFYPLAANHYDLGLSEKPDGLRLHLLMFGVRARRVRRRVGWLIGGLHETVCEEVFFDLFARDIGQHHAVNLDARGEALAGLLDHLGIVRRDINDIHVFEGEAVFAHDGADAVAPAAAGFEVGLDFEHASNMRPFRRESSAANFFTRLRRGLRLVPVADAVNRP